MQQLILQSGSRTFQHRILKPLLRSPQQLYQEGGPLFHFMLPQQGLGEHALSPGMPLLISAAINQFSSSHQPLDATPLAPRPPLWCSTPTWFLLLSSSAFSVMLLDLNKAKRSLKTCFRWDGTVRVRSVQVRSVLVHFHYKKVSPKRVPYHFRDAFTWGVRPTLWYTLIGVELNTAMLDDR